MNDQAVKWHVNTGGLIIVHPFLGHLFNRLNYLDDSNAFLNNEKRHRAVQLLHFVATGDTNFISESDLAMSKALCGMYIQEPLSLQIILNDDEKQTAVEMLNVIIDRWQKLGSTSIEGLQNTFLKRLGLLEFKDNSLQLTIESSGIDVLLDYIPWTINLIKLPWMEQSMSISWR